MLAKRVNMARGRVNSPRGWREWAEQSSSSLEVKIVGEVANNGSGCSASCKADRRNLHRSLKSVNQRSESVRDNCRIRLKDIRHEMHEQEIRHETNMRDLANFVVERTRHTLPPSNTK